MNRARYDLLRQAFGNGARAAEVTLFLMAKEYGVTVDDIVQAGLGRGCLDANAPRAATAIKAKVPDFFSPLAELWPFICGACRGDCARINVCAECQTARVCDTCLGRDGCPACTAKRQAEVARRVTASADMEANAKWLKRQLAEPLPEPEPDGVPAHPPEPPPDLAQPPDYQPPEPRENVPGMVPSYIPRRASGFELVAESPGEGVDSGA